MTSNASKKSHQNILVIEDRQADAELIRIYLQEMGFKHEFFTSDSLGDGLGIIRERDIDIVLLDLSLSDTTGFNTLRQYLKEAADVPVIVMTGLRNQRVGNESVNAGAQDYLIKGEFDARRLVSSIRYSLARFKKQADVVEVANQLSDEQQRLREVQRMSLLGDWEMDIVTKSMRWSAEMFRIFELKPQSFSPSLSDYLKLVHREDVEAVSGFFNQAIQQDESGPLEHRIFIDNRATKNLVVRTRLKFDEKSNKILLLGSVQDITQRTAPQKEPPQQAGHDSASTPTQHFLNQISFNIRTPLSTAVHLLYLLEQTSLNNQQVQLITDLKATVEDLSFTLSNLVNLSLLMNDNAVLSQDSYRPLEMLESVKRVMIFRANQNNHQIDIFIDPHLAFAVTGDSNKLGHLFFCLLELAFIHGEPGSFLHWRCELGNSVSSNPRLHLHLTYNGGLPDWPRADEVATAKEALEFLGPPTRNESRERLLAIAFVRLYHQLDAHFEYSRHTDHASIHLDLPLHPTAQYLAKIPAKPEKETHILLVEDHPMHQIATKQLLTTWSNLVRVQLARNGKDALEKMQQANFDLVLMDLQMPIMDGMTATAHIRKTSNLPVIALTASTSKQEEERCYEIGINDYLAKPFQPEALYQKIMRQLFRPETK